MPGCTSGLSWPSENVTRKLGYQGACLGMSESGHRSCKCGAVYDRSEHIVEAREISSFECAVHSPMSDLSPLSGEERKSNFEVVRSVDDPDGVVRDQLERMCRAGGGTSGFEPGCVKTQKSKRDEE